MDGVMVGEAVASGDTPHHIIHRMCELDMHISSDLEQPGQFKGVGFRLRLPDLQQGRHEVMYFSLHLLLVYLVALSLMLILDRQMFPSIVWSKTFLQSF